MGIKKFKEHYDIKNLVYRTEEDIRIANPYTTFITLKHDGEIIKKYNIDNDYWAKLQDTLITDYGNGTLKKILQEPDEYEGDLIPVYGFINDKLIETYCEKIGYPNLTIEGYIAFENVFFTDKSKAIHEKIEELRYMKQLYEEHKKKVLEKYKELRKKIIDNDNQIQKLKQELCKK
ncbi:hypothetical protein [Riemerella anatipestifer]|uniref:hypothetical protein n=1 Tax=Riemerella anatipestifer TaxID=34085 RepID=UPI001BD9E854|nr:hypothetical protein [Riemerella anatipestifer]MBT0554284.1 hypothetical protein [Riemerella anatipestifer]MCE3024979.1 hypothetical protein [Riemerella anatipestifer]MDY3449833.1 hypothetical protein [Riemerella anatipestifer]QYR04040.1 hypothetical protein J6M00_02705 [Riemerella anatipestifer]QYR06286.1 hypothetical protein J6M09_02945 [Riemerella anatipestifer]